MHGYFECRSASRIRPCWVIYFLSISLTAPFFVFACSQRVDRKLKPLAGLSASDVESKIERVDHIVKMRDLVLEAAESRLTHLEVESRKNRE